MQLMKYKRLPYPINLWSVVFQEKISRQSIPRDWENTLETVLATSGNTHKSAMLISFFKEKRTLEEIGRNHGICKEAVRQNINKELERLRHPTQLRIMQYGVGRTNYMRENHLGHWAIMDSRRDEGKEILSLSIDELNPSVRVRNCLNREKILTLGQLINYRRDELLQIQNLGKVCITEIESSLSEYGLTLKNEEE